MDKQIEKAISLLVDLLSELNEEQLIKSINSVKRELHKISPFSNEPVDCVLWVRGDCIEANDYNPNSVATPEMELLAHSIGEDGYTQPIVTWERDEVFEVVDGFHRNRVGKENETVRSRVRGYLPITVIKDSRTDRGDRIAATIRHNRARGKHAINSMSEIVVELKRRNWSDKKIGKELGMDPDEVLRLSQISGLAEMFADEEFSEAWEPTLGIADELKNIDNSNSTLDWVTSPLGDVSPGWHDRTEQSSVLYGENKSILGLVQKSRVEEKWHWYAYTQPMQSGEAATRNSAKAKVKKVRGKIH